jgi:hypothetical protein
MKHTFKCHSCSERFDSDTEEAYEVRDSHGHPHFICKPCYFYAEEDFDVFHRDIVHDWDEERRRVEEDNRDE